MEPNIKKLVDKFSNVYVSLIKTLNQTFPDMTNTLPQTLQEWQESKDKLSFLQDWFEAMTPHEQHIQEHTYHIFGANIPQLLQLQIPQLWVNRKFSKKSEEYLWIYLKSLYDISSEVHQATTKTVPTETTIAPPPTNTSTSTTGRPSPPLPPELVHLCNSISPDMLQNATQIAQNIAASMESKQQDMGKVSLPDLIPQIMQDPTAQRMFADMMAHQNHG